MPWLLAGAGIVVAAFGVAFAVMLTGNATPLASPHNHPAQAAVPLASATVTAPTQSPSPTPKPVRKRKSSASPTPAPSATSQRTSPAPAVSSQPPGRTPTSSVHLAATVSVDSGWHSQSFAQVVFEVTDTGSAATGQITASITLPAGASMMTGGGGGDGGDLGQSASDWTFGWTCQPTSAGATCQHGGIAAAAQAVGAIYIALSGTTACGQPVELAVASGKAAASAQSPDGIPC
jgi:hypothetical protein